ncbi:Ku protein [Bradyrhizobium sp. WSM471]|uniref:Ku protein n=1 Tax=Bradyrhizobium sp. WSM471 TaxID=319017 RepID=UPI00024D199A|nr:MULTISPECIES: Ku protein [Bradyrhizobium]EHR00273.1 hypothetical protein Bra471DRAFT_00837 [Bradyrhizobium sp. WSM471]UFW42388.1 Ku protein [Bradyrhizobium canariense]
MGNQAPRANWNGFLRLSLETRPVALPRHVRERKAQPAERNRIKSTPTPTPATRCPTRTSPRGYELAKGQYVEASKEELEEIALESTRAIEMDEFVDRTNIDPRYLIRPYYVRPEGKVGHDAFAVIRKAIREMDKAAIGRVMLTSREHITALGPMDKVWSGRRCATLRGTDLP